MRTDGKHPQQPTHSINSRVNPDIIGIEVRASTAGLFTFKQVGYPLRGRLPWTLSDPFMPALHGADLASEDQPGTSIERSLMSTGMKRKRQSLDNKGPDLMSDVASDVISIIAKRARGDNSHIELTDRLEDLGLESLDSVEMIFDLEERFDINIPYNANTNHPRTEFETVGDVLSAIQHLVDDKQ